MECFENLFTRSYARVDGTCPLISPQTSQLHTNALLSWALLLTICTASQLKDVLRKYEFAPSFLPRSNLSNVGVNACISTDFECIYFVVQTPAETAKIAGK